ncbi:MAG: glycosyltransferase family 2 protein [Anaerolineales bacterium]|nr:glycosyltransferase family 2 protein [Anaerolineales bacterium]
MTFKVSVIILCHNGVDLTLECLASLRQQDYPDLQIIVVDNASQDNTIEAVHHAYPEVEIVATGQNLGYAAGNNVGMTAALQHAADLVFLVNNDTRLESGCISTLVRGLEARPNIGMIGPMVYTWDNESIISSAGGQVDWQYGDAINVGMGEVDHGKYPARSVDFINGCGLMVTRAALEQAGMLDPKFFMYWEETDWCQRVRRAGFEIRFEPAARMFHKASIVVEELGPTTLYYMTRNRFLFFARHTPLARKPLTLARVLHGATRGFLLHRRAGRLTHANASKIAILHAVQQHWGRTDSSLWMGVPL